MDTVQDLQWQFHPSDKLLQVFQLTCISCYKIFLGSFAIRLASRSFHIYQMDTVCKSCIFSLLQTNEDTGTSRQIQRCPGGSETSTALSKTDEPKVTGTDEREVVLCKETELASSYTCGMFSALYKIFSSSVGPAVRHKCVNAILRVLCHAPPDLLSVVLKRHPISSLIGGMLQSSDLRVITNALQMAEIVMQKLPDVFHVSFRREGVMHRVRDLANGLLANKPSMSEQNSSSGNLANSNEVEAPGQRVPENAPSVPVTR